jgi:2-deoxy-D-gluconate 3-dehydrogenase
MKEMFDISGKKRLLPEQPEDLAVAWQKDFLKQDVKWYLSVQKRGTENHPGALDVAEYYCDHEMKAHGLAANLSTLEAGEESFKKALDLLGGELDVIVITHGIQRRHMSNEFPAKDWHDVVCTNLDSVFGLARPAADYFVQRAKADGVVPITNGPKKCYGKIIMIASMCTWFGGKTVPAYAAAKGGVAQLAKGMSNDLFGYGINVNALAPGYMDTDMNTALTNPENPRYMELTNRIPAHRWGTGKDMQGPCNFLASDASNYLGGAIIPVNGGYLVM